MKNKTHPIDIDTALKRPLDEKKIGNNSNSINKIKDAKHEYEKEKDQVMKPNNATKSVKKHQHEITQAIACLVFILHGRHRNKTTMI